MRLTDGATRGQSFVRSAMTCVLLFLIANCCDLVHIVVVSNSVRLCDGRNWFSYAVPSTQPLARRAVPLWIRTLATHH